MKTLPLLAGLLFSSNISALELFIGIGYEHGAFDYKDPTGAQYRDKHQGVFGMNLDIKDFRIQLYHSSSLDNRGASSFGDTNQLNILYTYKINL